MADFDPPFGISNGTRRFPNLSEQQGGFSCGPADRDLFNGLLYRIEAEIGEVITYAGIVPTDARMTQLREAIQALIPVNTDTFLESVNGDNNGGTIAPNLNNQFVLQNNDGTTWTLQMPAGLNKLQSPVSLWSTGEIASSTLPTNYTANISAYVPSNAVAIIVRVFLETDAGSNSVYIATGNSITVNGEYIGTTETGGPSGPGDNQWVGDFILPYTGNTVTARIRSDYDAGGVGSYQTFGRLVGYFL